MLLHYLFLSSFCWMLCEGIMLYLLLVVVFSAMSKKWWLFLLIGYREFVYSDMMYHRHYPPSYFVVTPLPIVVVSVSSRHSYYGVRNDEGHLQ